MAWSIVTSSAPDIPSEELVDLAAELRRLWQMMLRGVARPEHLEGLQKQQYWVLESLAHGPRRMSDLAECAQTSQTSLTGIVDRLEERGLVERVRSDEDRRVVEVAMTGLGREQTLLAQAAVVERLGMLLDHLTEDDRAELLRIVRLVTARHSCHSASGTPCH